MSEAELRLHADAPPLDKVPLQMLHTHKSVYRVFNGAWNRGGRFYGGGWQHLPKEARAHLLMNAMATTERDYRSLHPTMLYHWEGYDAPEAPCTLDNDVELRPLGKLALNIGLNAPTRRKALGAIGHEIQDDPAMATLLEEQGMSVAGFYDALLRHNAPIEEYLNTGVGIRLQYEGSVLMARIMNRFTRLGVPCLPIHDSAIVPAHFGDELASLMAENYERRFGRSIEVR